MGRPLFFRNRRVGPSLVHEDVQCPKIDDGLWRPSNSGQYVKIRQWRVLETKFRFRCNGRVMQGPGRCWWILMVFHMVICLSLFIAFEVYPHINSYTDIAVPLVVTTVCVYGITNAFFVALSDPGYLPPNPRKISSVENLHAKILSARESDPAKYFCGKCGLYRDWNVGHCMECDACIDRYDHHCYIFGTCVGRRNYRYLLQFLLATCLSMTAMTSISLIHLITTWKAEGFCAAAQKSPTSFVIAGAIVVPPGGIILIFYLTARHLYFTFTGKTLYQHKFGISQDFPHNNNNNWFVEGLHNFYTLICTKAPRRHIQPCEYIVIKAVPRDTVEHLHIQCVNPKKGSCLKKIFCNRKLFERTVLVKKSITLKRLQKSHIGNFNRTERIRRYGRSFEDICCSYIAT